jgi:hypothetical protein
MHHKYISEGAVVNKELVTCLWEAVLQNLNMSRQKLDGISGYYGSDYEETAFWGVVPRVVSLK